MKLIVQSTLITLLFLACYAWVVSTKANDWNGILPEHQWSANLIRAQDFLLTSQEVTTVVLGTSLSVRLNFSQQGITDLSLAGTDVSTGLEILQRSGARPTILLVESNLLGGTVDEDFVTRLYHPMISYMRRWFPVLQERNRPTAIIAGYWQAVSSKYATSNKKVVLRARPTIPLEEAGQEHLTEPEIQSLDRTLEKLVQMEDRGIKVIVFELPMSPEACNSSKFQARRKLISQRVNVYTISECREGKTTDGIHLNAEAAAAAAMQVLALAPVTRGT